MPNIQIHQIYYKPEQVSSLEKYFIPYNNIENKNPEWHEYWIFYQNYLNKNYLSAEYTGYVSWKFYQKTYLKGNEFIQFINENPGYDVYFINPFYENTYLFKNNWEQGNFFHHGIKEFTRKMLDNLGIKIDLDELVNSEEDTLYCNYWVGNKNFWEEYMKFTLPIYEYINNLSGSDSEYIHGRADKNINASYVTFIVERIFSTLLKTNKNIKYKAFLYDNKTLQNRYGERYPLLSNLKEIKILEKDNIAKREPEIYKVLLNTREILRDNYFNDKEISTLYVNTGNGYSEEFKLNQSVSLFGNKFDIIFDLKSFPEVKSLRWDPVSENLIECRIEQIIYQLKSGKQFEYPVDKLKLNGIRTKLGVFDFYTYDPNFVLSIQGDLEFIQMKGDWKLKDKNSITLLPKEVEDNFIFALYKKIYFKMRRYL